MKNFVSRAFLERHRKRAAYICLHLLCTICELSNGSHISRFGLSIWLLLKARLLNSPTFFRLFNDGHGLQKLWNDLATILLRSHLDVGFESVDLLSRIYSGSTSKITSEATVWSPETAPKVKLKIFHFRSPNFLSQFCQSRTEEGLPLSPTAASGSFIIQCVFK